MLDQSKNNLSQQMYEFAKKIFPFPRSLTGDGVRQTLQAIKELLPDLKIHEIPTGTKVFDWEVPKEWNIKDAYVINSDGLKVIDWHKNNLHVVSYSIPIDTTVTLKELKEHLHSLPDKPNAIPYITSYYRPTWGFCMAHREYQKLRDGNYRVVINSRLETGHLTYGDLIIPGREKKEILLSTYICHPSMANNECSGPVVTTFLCRWILNQKKRRYTYRLVFVPETIGAIAYISRNLDALRQRVKAGFILTCVGDDRAYSLMPARKSGVLPERVAHHVLDFVLNVPYTKYTFLERGSDERQYCAPGVDLPVVSIMRSKYGTYPEYHTSLDDLALISPDGLYGGFLATKTAIEVIEVNETFKSTVVCEPWFSKRGLRAPLLGGTALAPWSALVSNVMAYSDGEYDLLAIAETIGCSIFDVAEVAATLKKNGLLERVNECTPKLR